MPYPIPIEIIDPHRVLCDLDRYQIENMIWLRLAPQKESIVSVCFEISMMKTRHGSSQFASEYISSITTLFQDGKKTIVVSNQPTTALAYMDCTDQMVDSSELLASPPSRPRTIGRAFVKTNHASSQELAILNLHE